MINTKLKAIIKDSNTLIRDSKIGFSKVEIGNQSKNFIFSL